MFYGLKSYLYDFKPGGRHAGGRLRSFLSVSLTNGDTMWIRLRGEGQD
jgi:hypothetical protein